MTQTSQIIALGEASAANDSGGIFLTDPHKRVIPFTFAQAVCILCVKNVTMAEPC